jgi:hypothetical protein
VFPLSLSVSPSPSLVEGLARAAGSASSDVQRDGACSLSPSL